MKLLVGVTGASGMIFLKAFAELCRQQEGLLVHGICSDAGRDVIEMELGHDAGALEGVDQWFEPDNFFAPPASGSADYQAMVILPCSMGTLAAISSGLSINLIHRAADVLLKERKKVVLGVRETPLNRTHLSNMLTLHDAGAVICPPMPSFYFRPETMAEAATSYGWRVMDQLGIEVAGRKRWGKE